MAIGLANNIILLRRLRRQCKASCGLGWPTSLFFGGANVKLHVASDGQHHYLFGFMRFGMANGINLRRGLRRQRKVSYGFGWPAPLFFGGAFGASVKLHVAWDDQQPDFSAAPSAPV